MGIYRNEEIERVLKDRKSMTDKTNSAVAELTASIERIKKFTCFSFVMRGEEGWFDNGDLDRYREELNQSKQDLEAVVSSMEEILALKGALPEDTINNVGVYISNLAYDHSAQLEDYGIVLPVPEVSP